MIRFSRFLDTYIVWAFILLFFWLKYFFVWQKKYIIARPKKILVIRLWALGSSLLTFPMIKQLEGYYGKDAQYDLLATSRNISVFKNQWYFHQMYNLFSVRWFLKMLFSFKKYDIVIDAEEYFMISAFFSLWTGKINVWYTNIMVRWLAYACGVVYDDHNHSIINALELIKKIGIHYHVPAAMEPLQYTQKDMIKVDEFLVQYNWMLVCMHTGWAETAKERAWPQHKRVQFISKVIEKYSDIYIFLSGTSFEKQIVQDILHRFQPDHHARVINICGMFNLFEFAYLLKKCDLMVSNDTGPMHLAAAMGTKTIGLFGPELPRKFGPWPLDKNVWLYKGEGKSFINVHIAQWNKDKDYTINKINVDDVLHVLDRFMI